MKLRIFTLLFALSSVILIKGISVQAVGTPTIMPIGGGDDGIYAEFVQALVEQTDSNNIHILVIPVAYDPDASVPADQIYDEMESACNQITPLLGDCTVSLVPPLDKRTDLEGAVIEITDREISAILLLSSDSSEAMSVIMDTPVEQALKDAYLSGVIIAGSSEAGNILSRVMINGYVEGYSAEQAFQFGAVDVTLDEDQRGLEFGLQQGIIDTHIFQKPHLGRLLNAISSPEGPHVGIGIDAYSGASIHDNGRLDQMFGSYTAGILDAETYQAANSVQYRGANNFLSLRNVLVHLLAPSEFFYDLSTLQLSLASPPQSIQRDPILSQIPQSAGVLILSGGINAPFSNNKLLEHFVNLSGGQNASILIIASGFPTERAARVKAEEYQAALGDITSKIMIISRAEEEVQDLAEGVSGVLIIANDLSDVDIEMLPDIRSLWLQGTPIMADDAAVGLIGTYYVALDQTPDNPDEQEAYTQETFIKGQTDIRQGLGLIDAMIEPSLLADNHWGRLFSLVYSHPEFVGLGLNRDTALFVDPEATTIEGENVLITLDLRNADLAEGDTGGYIIANGLVDVFTPGEVLHFQDASINDRFIHAATPMLPTFTATLTPTSTPTATPSLTITPTQLLQASATQQPTRPPRPTPAIPPPTDTNLTNAMIIVGVFAVIAVFIGFWLNRRSI